MPKSRSSLEEARARAQAAAARSQPTTAEELIPRVAQQPATKRARRSKSYWVEEETPVLVEAAAAKWGVDVGWLANLALREKAEAILLHDAPRPSEADDSKALIERAKALLAKE